MAESEDRKELSKLLSGLPYSYDISNSSKEIKDNYTKYENKKVSIAGRIIVIRKSGKLIFADLLDRTGKIQIYFDYSALGEKAFAEAKKLIGGDIIGVKGTVMKTTKGEISVKPTEYVLLAKAMRTLPEKWHGLQDVETRYRKRHLDLIMNEEVREIFIKKSMIISEIRKFLDSKGFLEVDTSIIHPLYGGADARPFKTYVNTLDEDHFLRIATELNLKRLIIGGLERVYELGKVFRNEDADTTHNPEYTHLEAYAAYWDYEDIMRLEEEMLEHLAHKINGGTQITYQDKKLDFKAPFKRIKFLDSIKEKTGKDILDMKDEELFKFAESLGIKFIKGRRNRPHAYDKIFETVMESDLIQPTFVLDFPRESSPLTRPKRGNPMLAERFDLYINGNEIGPAYSELNDPIIQKENFDAQEKLMQKGDDEVPPRDMDFIEALEHGMPPTGGLGMGIDRLVMLFTNKSSIKEVLLFPMEKRGK